MTTTSSEKSAETWQGDAAAPGARPRPTPSGVTHELLNQVPPRVDVNEFASDPALVEGVGRWGSAGRGVTAVPDLHAIGELVGSAAFQADAEAANVHEPVLRSHDRYGARLDEVEYHPSYHRVIGAAVGAGAHTSAWARPGVGASVDRAAAFFLFAQVEPGHACPVSMTHAGVATMRLAASTIRDEWMPRLLAPRYDSALHPGKASALLGMAMTEKQGGSDVRANTTVAADAGDGTHRLTGHKWFCSAPMSDGFFVLAKLSADRPAPSCFFVPRVLPDGERNVFRIQRLKDKLGNRANASSEVEFDGTVGWLVGEPDRGVSAILPMVGRTRLDCVIGTAAGMRQAVAEAAHHVRHRSAFGRTLLAHPAMTAVIAELQLESEAATITALRLARAYDEDAERDPHESAFRRVATAVAKYWVCKRGPQHAAEALECLGGNGYTEGFPLARRYREQPVMAVWEGSGNVIALDVLRALGREPEAAEAFFDVVGEASGVDALFDAAFEQARTLAVELSRTDADTAARRARELTERMAVLLQASLLLQHAPAAVSDLFTASRLGPDRSALYGALPAGGDLDAVVARA